MPWTPKQMAAKGARGNPAKAAAIANAIYRKSGDKGKAITIALSKTNEEFQGQGYETYGPVQVMPNKAFIPEMMTGGLWSLVPKAAKIAIAAYIVGKVGFGQTMSVLGRFWSVIPGALKGIILTLVGVSFLKQGGNLNDIKKAGRKRPPPYGSGWKRLFSRNPHIKGSQGGKKKYAKYGRSFKVNPDTGEREGPGITVVGRGIVPTVKHVAWKGIKQAALGAWVGSGQGGYLGAQIAAKQRRAKRVRNIHAQSVTNMTVGRATDQETSRMQRLWRYLPQWKKLVGYKPKNKQEKQQREKMLDRWDAWGMKMKADIGDSARARLRGGIEGAAIGASIYGITGILSGIQDKLRRSPIFAPINISVDREILGSKIRSTLAMKRGAEVIRINDILTAAGNDERPLSDSEKEEVAQLTLSMNVKRETRKTVPKTVRIRRVKYTRANRRRKTDPPTYKSLSEVNDMMKSLTKAVSTTPVSGRLLVRQDLGNAGLRANGGKKKKRKKRIRRMRRFM